MNSKARITVQVPSRITIEMVLPFPPPAGADEYIVDATDLGFVEPIGLVSLALLLNRLVLEGSEVTFKAPRNPDVNCYLARMDFYTHMANGVRVENAVDPASMSRNDCSAVLIPLIPFRTYIDVEDLTPIIYRFLQGARLLPSVYAALILAIPELCGNAAEHSGSPCGGFIAAQTYKGRGSCLAVGDVGMGIRAHLARNPLHAGIPSDEQAIRKAIEPGVTGTSEPRGQGFDDVLVELEQADRAELFIKSGHGWLKTFVNGQKARRKESGTDESNQFPGTIVQLFVASHKADASYNLGGGGVDGTGRIPCRFEQ